MVRSTLGAISLYYGAKCKTGRTEVIGNVEPRWTRVSDTRKIFMALAYIARVHHLATCQKDELVEHSNNVASWLMDSEHHSASVGLGEGDKRINHVKGIV